MKLKLSKPQVAELLRRYQLWLDAEPAPAPTGRLIKTCKILKRLKVLSGAWSLTPLGLVTAQAHGAPEIPGGMEAWLEANAKAAEKRAKKVRGMMKVLAESKLEGDDAYDEMEALAAKLRVSGGDAPAS